MKRKGIIFDLDGTLIDTLGDIAASMNKALEKNGFAALQTEAYREKVGWGIRRLAALCLPQDKINFADKVADDAVTFYSAFPLVYTKPYPGITELISQVKQKKIRTAVLTNKPDQTAQAVVNGLFPVGSFDFIRGEIFGKPRKPDPSCVWELLVDMDLQPAEVIFAGDSEVDIETAVTSGCFPLGVSWGYRSRDIILNAGARRIIDKPEELLELL
ncbi:MAG: HAD family hydrolase [Treponema sp.]|nr:HAD family hydrolase [Treponema sp.]